MYAGIAEDSDDEEEEDEDELDVGGGLEEEALLLGGEGVRARTSTTFRPAEADDTVAEEEEDEVFIAFSSPEPGDSDRLVIPTARDAAVLGRGGDGDLERGTASTTFKVEDIDDDDANDVDGVEDDADAESLCGAAVSKDI